MATGDRLTPRLLKGPAPKDEGTTTLGKGQTQRMSSRFWHKADMCGDGYNVSF